MKRGLLVAGTVLVLALLPGMTPGVVRADPSSGAVAYAVGGGSVSGSEFGFTNAPFDHLAFSAHQTSTDPPTGHVTFWAGQPPVQKYQTTGDVTCLTIVGNQAAIGGVWTKSNAPNLIPPGTVFLLYVTDNGPPVNGMPTDTWLEEDFPPETSPSCPPGTGSNTLTLGNFVVNGGTISLLDPVTDNTSFKVDSNYNLYLNTGTVTSPTWTLVE